MIPAPQLALLRASALLPGKGGAEARQLLTACKIPWGAELATSPVTPAVSVVREAATSHIKRTPARARASRARASTVVRGWAYEAFWLLMCAALLLHCAAASSTWTRHVSPGQRVTRASTTVSARRSEPRRAAQNAQRR